MVRSPARDATPTRRLYPSFSCPFRWVAPAEQGATWVLMAFRVAAWVRDVESMNELSSSSARQGNPIAVLGA